MMKYMLAQKSLVKPKLVSIRHGLFNRLVIFPSSHRLKRETRLEHLKAQRDYCFSLNKTILLQEKKPLIMKMIFRQVCFHQMMRVQ